MTGAMDVSKTADSVLLIVMCIFLCCYFQSTQVLPVELLKSVVLLRRPLFTESMKQRDADLQVLNTLSSVSKYWSRLILHNKEIVQRIFHSKIVSFAPLISLKLQLK